jgi:hypothetical protein
MKKLTKEICLTCLLLGIPAYLFADRAHDLASQAASQTPASCNPSTLDTKTCHDKFPTGCTNAKHPNYDAYLNFLKDQNPGPNEASTELSGNDFQSLEGKIPAPLKRRGAKHANSAPALANLGEGNIFAVIGFLYFVEDTGRESPPNLETGNCKLPIADSFDYHLGLGFDPALAKTIRDTHPQPNHNNPTEMEKTSVVAEMTPHTRHPKWTFDRVNALQGQQVKVVGQLMVDNVHLNPSDDCKFPHATSSCCARLSGRSIRLRSFLSVISATLATQVRGTVPGPALTICREEE